ncbi:hypothetical protein SAMN05519103_07093 [Rhizobiales bacterium GAS113]|jgi:hypothetical protein|nr:hypothetical protein SAMN05519103_07093 [Rhizobiales bacterium GAS113]SED50502.1 hypothetical protein SAMN05519104_3687 [Rhizobiales bacterium GAS188]
MTMPPRLSIRAAALLAGLMLAGAGALASDWPPVDPGEAMTKIAIDSGFAQRLRGLRSFGELQAAAGARGHISDIVRDGDSPHAVYDWTSAANGGRMRVFLYEGGDFSAAITSPGQADEIVLNNFEAFICASCSPPVTACGHRPSWVPHDLHWDVYDCARTLTGPQSVHSRQF